MGDPLLRRVRLLPVTMVGLAVLLAVKSAGLVGAAYGAAESTAPASQTSPPAIRPASEPPAAAAPGAPVAAAAAGAEAEAMASPAAAASQGAAAEPMPSPAERVLLLDLRRRRVELDARAAALDSREALLGAAEKRIAVRVSELLSLQTRLEALEAARRDRDEASWRGLVRVYETMKPKDAAVIFNDLDSPVLLQVVDRMKDAKAAAILAAMAPDRARRLTADLSALRSRANAPPDPSADPASSRAPPDAAGRPIRPASAPAATAATPPGASP